SGCGEGEVSEAVAARFLGKPFVPKTLLRRVRLELDEVFEESGLAPAEAASSPPEEEGRGPRPERSSGHARSRIGARRP
ncbi:MAG: hypothetical protein OEY14_18435, partial [Myxococcales bacterium]|nr:hypothetical protein [Myxococcales bacterium]